MKVAFLTLTAPENYTTQQINTAFESFLDYLTRTANCRFVYKKEVGFKNGKFHIHLMINNFIPFYIVAWKWKKLLMFQNPVWPKYDNGKDYNSHTRIELPRSKKMAAAYIAKYMTKEGFIVEPVGRLWGASDCIKKCKELILIENDVNVVEYHKLLDCRKVIQDDFMTFVCVDWFEVKDIAPDLYRQFLRQYYKFSEIISLEQKFKFC
jgi:hypothetical protein